MRRTFVVSCLVTFTFSLATVAHGAPTAQEKQGCLAAADRGQDLRSQGKLLDARAQFLQCARDPCPAIVQSDCAGWVKDLERDVPTVVVRVTRGGSDVVDAEVTIDGGEPIAIDGKPVSLDPGAHAFAVAGEAASEQKIVLASGEKNRMVVLTLAAQGAKTSEEPPPVAPVRDGSAPAWPWIVGGIGVVGLASFTYFGLTGAHDRNSLQRTCAPYCAQSDVDAAHRKLFFADLSLGVALVALGVATYGFLSTPRVSAGVAILPGGGGASIQGAF